MPSSTEILLELGRYPINGCITRRPQLPGVSVPARDRGARAYGCRASGGLLT